MLFTLLIFAFSEVESSEANETLPAAAPPAVAPKPGDSREGMDVATSGDSVLGGGEFVVGNVSGGGSGSDRESERAADEDGWL